MYRYIYYIYIYIYIIYFQERNKKHSFFTFIFYRFAKRLFQSKLSNHFLQNIYIYIYIKIYIYIQKIYIYIYIYRKNIYITKIYILQKKNIIQRERERERERESYTYYIKYYIPYIPVSKKVSSSLLGTKNKQFIKSHSVNVLKYYQFVFL